MAEYWHGGPRGLKGYILPSEETGAPTTADYGAEKVCRRDRIYLVSLRLAAEMFAAMAPRKKVSVYLVEPIGDVEPDIDCEMPGLSFQAARARILKEFPMQPHYRLQMLHAAMGR